VFSELMLKQWVDFKRNEEYYQVRNRPHPYEMSLYFDV
jgi:glutamine synthetase